MAYDELGPVLKYHRKRAGLSRKAMSVLADVGQTAIYDVEHGKETVRLDTVKKLCAVLNIGLKWESPLMDEFRERKAT
ncbi:MAG: HTH-type transcriptional regulator/antitoxin HipB [Thalassolituus oleivorans]|jgi:HTH-type transcriptional regulator/antitoxin HipB